MTIDAVYKSFNGIVSMCAPRIAIKVPIIQTRNHELFQIDLKTDPSPFTRGIGNMNSLSREFDFVTNDYLSKMNIHLFTQPCP